MTDIPTLDSYGSKLDLTLDPSTCTPDEAMLSLNLDPAEWIKGKAHLSVGKSPSLKLELTHRGVRPARLSGPHHDFSDQPDDRISFTAVIVSDQQCPYQDPYLHEEVCGFLYRNNPRVLINNGDTFDFPSVSSYDPNPRFDTHINSGIDSGYSILRDYVQAARPSKSIFIPGNHEQRLQKYLNKHAPALIGIRVAEETQDILTIPYLARLDELGYEFLTGEYNDWPQAVYEITPELQVRHGYIVRGKAGQSVAATVEKTGYSTIIGHVHSLALVPVTNGIKTLWGAEGGTLTTIKGGLGYCVSPQWENGCVAVKVYEDGSFIIDLLRYDQSSRKLHYGRWS